MRNILTFSALACVAAIGLTACADPYSPPPIDESQLRIDAARSTIVTGESIQLRAIVTDPSDRVLDGSAAIWTSSSPDVASVSPDGLVRGVAQGSAEITASYGGETARLTIGVVETPTCARAMAVPSGCRHPPV